MPTRLLTPRYIGSVPLFDRRNFQPADDRTLTILKANSGQKITLDSRPINGYFIKHSELKAGKEVVIRSSDAAERHGSPATQLALHLASAT